MNGHTEAPNHYDQAAQPPPSGGLRSSFEDDASQAPSQSTWSSAPTNNGQQELRRRPSILDSSMDHGLMAQVIDNSQSEKRENRVRIVDPPSDEDDKKPKGILKKPTEKFPENPNAVREGVAPLKDVSFSHVMATHIIDKSLTIMHRRIRKAFHQEPAGPRSTAASSTRKPSRKPTNASKSVKTSSSSSASSPKKKSRNSPTARVKSEVRIPKAL